MSNEIRPISRMMALELSDAELEMVSGGAGDAIAASSNTDFYTRTTKPGILQYDGSKNDD